VNSSLISVTAALRALDAKLQRDAKVLLLRSPDEIEEGVADCHTVLAECGHSIRSICQPLSRIETETLQSVVVHLSRTLMIYRYVLRAAQRSCCATLSPIDARLQQSVWKG
jgi:hypothetical protein